jgi:hypothetical protein
MISPQEAIAAKQSILFMCQTLMGIVNEGNPEKMVAVCDGLATAFCNPDWLGPVEVWSANSRKKMN